MKTAVSVERLEFTYATEPVLQEVSFAVAQGDFFVIIGPNGSGKTTLMRMLAGTLKARSGQVQILNEPIESFSRKALARQIALVPQLEALDFPFRVSQFVLMGRAPHLGILGLEQASDFEIARQAMAFTAVEHLAARKMSQLSGGERQRILIARAICQQSKIILLDEPTASLDLAHQIQVMDLMKNFQQEKGVTIVMVSHDVNLASIYGDQLLLLKKGRIVKQGQPGKVLNFQDLEHAYGCKLLVDESPLGKFPRVTPVPRKYLNPKAGLE
ncbi:MAG: ABC transporter [Desulfobacteraceae bacterium 4572_123]|nr:MAG: ABC transporter [Desulfobacteraceae bacterium 4572_123]